MGLSPDSQYNEKTYKFIGIYGKNREEWALTHLANYFNSTITAAFYDTLGPLAVQFVIN